MKTTQTTSRHNVERQVQSFQWHFTIDPVRCTDIAGKEAMDGSSSNDAGCSIKPIDARFVPWTAE